MELINNLFLSIYPERYKWQHHGSANIHGFIWLQDALNMDTLNWEEESKVASAKVYFDQYISAWRGD